MTTELIPAGIYRARGVSAQLGFTSTGKEQVAISFVLTTPGFEGQHLPYYGTFGEKALEITTKALRACGWQGLDLSDLSGIDTAEVNLVVEHEEYPVGSGNFSAKVRWVNDGQAGLMKNVMADTERRAFAARMRGAIAGLGVPTSAPKPPAPRPAAAPAAQRQAPRPSGPPEPPPHTDDDLPF